MIGFRSGSAVIGSSRVKRSTSVDEETCQPPCFSALFRDLAHFLTYLSTLIPTKRGECHCFLFPLPIGTLKLRTRLKSVGFVFLLLCSRRKSAVL